LGIRPEHFILSEDDIGINIVAEVVEQLGNESIIYFKLNDLQLTARFTANEFLKAGETFKIKIDSEKIYFFDPATALVI
jgi:ABC-type sugar transport system ATPase subunit